MATQEIELTNDALAAEDAPTVTTDDTPPKPERTRLNREAISNLRTARRTLADADWEHDDRAAHLLAEAKVLALMDLANAFREARG
jgi:hypothetical protein